MVPYCVRKKESFVEQYIQGRENDSYITVNQFSGKYRYNEGTHKWGWFRQEQDCVAINGFLVDFDIMKGEEVQDHYTIEEGDRIVREVLFKVNRLVEEGAMVKPTLVTLSGRGIQMIFLYEEATSTSDTGIDFDELVKFLKVIGIGPKESNIDYSSVVVCWK